jgi:magnesium-protoporphyrin O-methyltransferase
MQCCDSRYPAAERQFGPKIADRDMRRYRQKGPDAPTRLLLADLRGTIPTAESLLDVGGGVGVLDFELLPADVKHATLVDASSPYLDAARQEAERRGYADRLRLIAGDFSAVASGIDSADIVTMHRVVCCYPHPSSLLTEAARRCRRVFAFSYPRDRWFVRLWLGFENLQRRILGNPFRAFVHSPPSMEAILLDAGLQRISRRLTLIWCVEVYGRVTNESTVVCGLV